MLVHPTLNNLKTLNLLGMIKAFEDQSRTPEVLDMTFEDRLGLLVDAEINQRDNKRLQSRLKSAHLRQSACIEDINLKQHRGLDKSLWLSLCDCQWANQRKNILITGKTGVGKSFIAAALAQKACRDGYSAVFHRTQRLFHELAVAKATSKYSKTLASIQKKDVLILDDFGLAPLTDEQRRDLLEIFDDRYNKRSTIIVSQLPTELWHDTIGDPTIADAILDRVVHNSYRLFLDGPTLRDPKNIIQ